MEEANVKHDLQWGDYVLGDKDILDGLNDG
jgi:hypothetical protein